MDQRSGANMKTRIMKTEKCETSHGPARSDGAPETLLEDLYQTFTRRPRTLVLCFDGTSNEFSKHNTNVVKLYSILKKDTPESQLCYYQAGVGTYFEPGVVSPLFRTVAGILDEALAWYLSEHIMDGYKFLMQNYHEGDSVCMFGFSRGAYTARALAGMLHKVGLLSKDNLEQIPFAWKLYKSSSDNRSKLAARFKRVFCREVPIEFLGVWDTVASVGILNRRTLPFVGTNSTMRVFRQALALDECRAKFCPNLYHRPVERPIIQSPQHMSMLRGIVRALSFFKRRKRNPDTPHVPHGYAGQGKKPKFKTDVKEVWFAGSHSDVGGGLANDTEEHALSNIPLRWMMREILRAQCHIRFDETALELWNIPIATMEQVMPTTRGPSDSTLRGDETDIALGQGMLDKDFAFSREEANASTSTSSSLIRHTGALQPSPHVNIHDALDVVDAVQEMGNSFKKNPFWWLLELVPTYHEWQNEEDEWVGKWGFHLGLGREVPPEAMFHQSVKTRMDNPVLNYSPKAQHKKGTEKYVS